MHIQTGQPANLLQYIIPAVIIGVVLFFRVRRMATERPLRLEYLWVFPAIYLAIASFMLWELAPTVTGWEICGAALLVGGAIGWQRGKTMTITVDPETHALNQKASIAGIAFLVAIILVRQLAGYEGRAMGREFAVLVSEALVVFALGLFTVQRIEMFLRARRLLEEARARRSA